MFKIHKNNHPAGRINNIGFGLCFIYDGLVRIVSFGILYYLANIAMFANIVKPGPGIIAERF